MDFQTVSVERTVRVPAIEVYRAFTRPIALREWMCDGATCLARPGGHLHLWWNSGYYASGEFITLKEHEEIAFTWYGRGEPGPTRVRVTLAPVEDGTAVTLEHAGFGAGDGWAAARKESAAGWATGLENLQAVLETGPDLRIVRRPMLGINLGEFNADVAAKLGVPVSEGIRLTGTLAGMGAHAAGLAGDDVIVSIGGKGTTDWPALVNALQGRRAGETVEVVFYRGAERRSVAMTLSPRPLPEAPPTPAGLAEAIQKIGADCQAELVACFAGVSDAEAGHKPAPAEWSALETVGHLIAGDRETLAWIADLINDDERWSDRFENPTAVHARVGATATAYPTVVAMLDAWQRTQVEIVAMVAALPPEFVSHKGSYWRLGYNLLQGALDHMHEHAAQIRAAIEAARK